MKAKATPLLEAWGCASGHAQTSNYTEPRTKNPYPKQIRQDLCLSEPEELLATCGKSCSCSWTLPLAKVPVLSHALLSEMGSCHDRGSWHRHGWTLQWSWFARHCSKDQQRTWEVHCCVMVSHQLLSEVSFTKHLASEMKNFVKISLISFWKSEDLKALESSSTWEFKCKVSCSSHGVNSRCKVNFFNFLGWSEGLCAWIHTWRHLFAKE